MICCIRLHYSVKLDGWNNGIVSLADQVQLSVKVSVFVKEGAIKDSFCAFFFFLLLLVIHGPSTISVSPPTMKFAF